MSEAKPHVYTDGLRAHQKRMEHIFNNPQYSDTEFTVQKQKFYAVSQVVCVASRKLDAIVSEHFAHCNDKKIKLYDVKCEKSFLVILQYMYGLDINLSEMTMHVLCGVINLAETYQLDEFAKDLKSYLNKLDTFEMDSLAVLLNTSRKCNLDELYKKVKMFAFKNAEEFVKHDSIVSLQYEVLLNLIKSDNFCAPEIDILKAVLEWHNGMNTKEDKKSIDEEDEIGKDVDSSDDRSQSDESFVKSDLMDMASIIDDKTEKENEYIEHVELEDNPNKNNANSTPELVNQKDKCADLVKSFSENVLKSLLLHVRIKQMSMFDIMTLWQTNLVVKYKHILEDVKHFALINEPRRNIQCLFELKNINKVFTTKYRDCNITDKYDDILMLNYHDNDIVLAIYSERFPCPNAADNYFLKMYLECTADKLINWECTIECHLSLISGNKSLYPTRVLPLKSLIFNQDNSVLFLGEFYRDSPGWYTAFVSKATFKFEVLFKSIRINSTK